MDLCYGHLVLFFTTYGVISFTSDTLSFTGHVFSYFFKKKLNSLPESSSESESESEVSSDSESESEVSSESDNLDLDPDYIDASESTSESTSGGSTEVSAEPLFESDNLEIVHTSKRKRI